MRPNHDHDLDTNQPIETTMSSTDSGSDSVLSLAISVVFSWRSLAILLLVANLKSIPFAWHVSSYDYWCRLESSPLRLTITITI